MVSDLQSIRNTKKYLTAAIRTFFAFILVIGLLPALPQQAYAADYSNSYHLNLIAYNATVTAYKYDASSGQYTVFDSYKDGGVYPNPKAGSKWRVIYSVPENTKPELTTFNICDKVTCEKVEGYDYAWDFTFSEEDPGSSYDDSLSTISLYAYTPSTITCEDVENGTITYKFTEGDAYDGTVQATFTPDSDYVLEKAEYKRSSTNFKGSWSELTTEKQEDGTYSTQIKINKSTTNNVYSIQATFIQTEKLDIASEDDLLDFATRVKNGESFAGSTVTLKKDITLSSDWTTIGNTVFRGTFNGGGHTISGFNVQGYVKSDSGNQCGGLFYSTNSATIKNLTLEGNIVITDMTDYYQLGIFSCLAANSTFENCTSKVNITFAKGEKIGGIAGWAQNNCKFTGCSNEGVISCTDEGSEMGGIVGYASNDYSGKYTMFTNCANYADIRYDSEGATSKNSSGFSLGGIAGNLYNGQFESCLNKGNIVAVYRGAGICGNLYASSGSDPYSFSNCYNTGNITVSSPSTKSDGQPVAAGICTTGSTNTKVKANFANCYNTGKITRTGSMADANPNTCVGQIAPAVLLSGSNYDGFKNYDMTENGNWTMDKCYGADDTFDASKLGSAYRDEAAGVTGGSPLLTWEPADATNSKARIAATSVALDATTLSLEQYDEYTLSATVEPTSTTDKIEWTSSNEKVATVSSSVNARSKGMVSAVGAGECTITATAGDVSATVTVSVSAYNGELLYGGEEVTSGGTYKLASTAKGTVTIATDEAVTIRGMGAGKAQKYQNSVYFDCTGQTTNLTLRDMYLSTASNTCIVNFKEKGNILNIEGTCVLDYTDSKYAAGGEAVVHVPQGASLTVTGTGTLYAFKHTAGTVFGGDNAEYNGDITFDMEGSLFAKGSKQGAVIGSGASASTSSGTPGTISFERGTYNLISNSAGAVIGGGAGGGKAASGTNVYIRGGSVNVNCDWSGAAIGGGGWKSGNDSDGGTLTITGGSLRTYVDTNAVKNLPEVTYYKGLTLVEGINNIEVTAKRVDDTGQDVFMCAVDTKDIKANENGEYEVTVDGESFFTGGLHSYAFLQEAVDRNDGQGGTIDTSVDYTPDNWVKSVDTCLYLYLTGEDHTIEVNVQEFSATYNASAKGTVAETNGGSFTVEEVTIAPHTTGDINNNGKINIVDAQLCYDLACGNYKSGDDPYGAFPMPEGWNTETLIAAVDVNEDGTLTASDAFAIQYYVHYGAFGAKD